MKFKFDHDYHIHSWLSSCSRDPNQTAERILEYAKEKGLKQVCVTDHYWDAAVEGASGWYKPQNFEHISRIKPLPLDDGIEFLFGCEGEMDKFLTLGIPKERYEDFDFIIIPTTHLHMKGFTISDEDGESNERRAELWVQRLSAVLNMALPFHKVGIAHPVCSLMNNKSREDYIETLGLISDEDMRCLFEKAARVGCGIEINQYDMSFSEAEAEAVLRPYRIAKECGCKFYLGSDAHHPDTFDLCADAFERAIDLLGLTEEDKFQIK